MNAVVCPLCNNKIDVPEGERRTNALIKHLQEVYHNGEVMESKEETKYVYIKTEKKLWTVGHYDPCGRFIPESDYAFRERAAERVHYLNGGS